MLLIGLTGGIGTGKSTVARMLAEKGARIISADALAREVVAKGEPALQLIAERFGPEVITPDGELDRARLARIVFSDAEARADLERIVHPRVRERLEAQIKALKAEGSASVVVYDAPLLYETGASLPMLSTVVVVYAPKEVQKRRLIEDRGMTPEEAERRIAAQLPTEGKARRADYVIDNSGDLAETRRQVDRLWEAWTGCASH